MAKTKELAKDTRKKIVDLQQAGKNESMIGKQIGVNESTVSTGVSVCAMNHLEQL